ncbi:MAG: cysteine peptidase family C39 domain-containing protein [Sedimentisphaerales bacterium]
MNSRIIAMLLIWVFVMSSPLFADRTLSRSETVQLISHLTSTLRWAWIPQGTIEATHESFNMAEKRTIKSTESIKYDGNKFNWEVDVVSEAVDGQPNSLARPDSYLNEKNVYVWDGRRYNMYFKKSKSAISTDNITDTPPTVTGCLTAGIVPWGYGFYAYEKLIDNEIDAAEIENNGQPAIRLIIKNSTGIKLSMILDKAKDYAVVQNVISSSANKSCISQEYSNYVLKGGRWIPATILIERYADCQNSGQLISYDYWVFDSINIEKPRDAAFVVSYEQDTLIEYRSGSDISLLCQYSPMINVQELVEKKLVAMNKSDGRYNKNCATSALKYVMESLEVNITDNNLAVLVDTSKAGTSLLDMQVFVREMGLQSLAARINVRALNRLSNYKPIVYLPWEKHYVVFSHIENDNVWVIDMAGNRLCYDIPLEKFVSAGIDTNTVVLFVSDKSMSIQENYTDISDNDLVEIVGASGTGFGKYSCTEVLQVYDIEFCQETPSPLIPCIGRYTVWANRYGCKEDVNGGECRGYALSGSLSALCGEDPYYPGSCSLIGTWRVHNIRACY